MSCSYGLYDADAVNHFCFLTCSLKFSMRSEGLTMYGMYMKDFVCPLSSLCCMWNRCTWPQKEIKQTTVGKRHLDIFLGNFKGIHRNQGEHSSLWYHTSVHLSSQFAYLSEEAITLPLFLSFWKGTAALQQYWESYSRVRSNLPFRQMTLLPAAPNSFFSAVLSHKTVLAEVVWAHLYCSLVLGLSDQKKWGVTDWNVVWAPTKPVVRVVVQAGMLLNLHYPSAFLQTGILMKRSNNMCM